MPSWPVPPADAKQTNCWRFVLIIGVIVEVIAVISIIAGNVYVEQDADKHDSSHNPHHHAKHIDAVLIAKAAISQIFELIVFVIVMYHTQYIQLSATDHELEVTMGPLRWPLLEWIFSSQVRKDEISGIERKHRSCIDIVCRQYCVPVQWCCCHKSYSAYFFPLCCNGINTCKLCEGDAPSDQMIQINLTQDPCSFGPMCCKRCAPCASSNPFTCYVYNRIALSIKDESWIEQLRVHGYPLKEYLIEPQMNPVTLAEERNEVLI